MPGGWDKYKIQRIKRNLADVMPKADDPNVIDREKAFVIYLQYSGDLVRTAEALHMEIATLAAYSEEDQWAVKAAPILKLRNSTSPAEVERGLNRISNFIQAFMMRTVLERQITALYRMTEKELMDVCMSEVVERDKEGNVVSTSKKLQSRPLADLASALEKIHVLSYMALADTATERNLRAKRDDEAKVPAVDIHAEIAKAMADGGNTPIAKAIDEGLTLANEERAKEIREGIERSVADARAMANVPGVVS
jgi:hypothetical protein